MNIKELRKLIRKKILESFDKKIQEKRLAESSDEIKVMSEKELTHFVRSQLRESQIRSSLNEEK